MTNIDADIAQINPLFGGSTARLGLRFSIASGGVITFGRVSVPLP
jgi:hypothetical protein